MGPRAKNRNSEKRKEKSRDAARCRRGRESKIFFDLVQQLPFPDTAAMQMDKARIMRLAICQVKLRTFLGPEKRMVQSPIPNLDGLYLKAIDGILIIIGRDGGVIYVSANCSKYLGLNQLDIMGQSIYDISHPCDSEDIREMLNNVYAEESQKDVHFFARLKCTLTSKGRNVNLKSANYKVMCCNGHLISYKSEHGSSDLSRYLVITMQLLPHPSHLEVPMDNRTFLSKHSMSMKYTYCDERIRMLLGYETSDILGKSFYEYCHAVDGDEFVRTFKLVFAKGQAMTRSYRFLAKHGGYAWMVTQATVIYNPKNENPESVVCINYVLSEIEEVEKILSVGQMKECLNESDASENEVDGICSTILGAQPPCGKVMQLNRPQSLASDSLTSEEKDDADSHTKDLSYLDESIEQAEITSLHDENLFDTLFPSIESLAKLPDTKEKELPFMASTEELLKRSEDPSLAFVNMNSSVVETNENACNQQTTDVDWSLDVLDEVNFEARAPYIPMTGEEDLLFSASPIPLVNPLDEEPRKMLGITESIFAPLPPEMKSQQEFTAPPLFIVKQQAMERQHKYMTKKACDVARNAGPPKMKRPSEMNRLENGPPVKLAKGGMAEVESNLQITSETCDGQGDNSVLCNLLLYGKDANHGYEVPSPKVLDFDLSVSNLEVPPDTDVKSPALNDNPFPVESIASEEQLSGISNEPMCGVAASASPHSASINPQSSSLNTISSKFSPVVFKIDSSASETTQANILKPLMNHIKQMQECNSTQSLLMLGLVKDKKELDGVRLCLNKVLIIPEQSD